MPLGVIETFSVGSGRDLKMKSVSILVWIESKMDFSYKILITLFVRSDFVENDNSYL
ncbi:hypothetical protein EMQ_1597 [Acetobacter aceti NBRC 14818]|uniref:Uncharacterized protein n=1 Tax=Acetobacter aceti NBRC 14818 TaxID=887700 RepID=A0AB33IGN6_ACEAC|nr:hypothetical protein EMQ_1597 [Acetobacter aceti NBRC 14818]